MEWMEQFQCFGYKYSNWDIQRIMMGAFGIDLSPWVVKVWREAALRPLPTLLPELQRYKEQPLTLIVSPRASSEEKKEPLPFSGAPSRHDEEGLTLRS